MSPNSHDAPKPSELRPDVQPSVSGSPSQRAASYTPPPNVSQPERSSGSRLRMLSLGVLVAVALGGSAWYGLSTRNAPPPAPSVAAATQTQKTFSVSGADLDAQATAELKALIAGRDSTTLAANPPAQAVNDVALIALAHSSSPIVDDITSGRRVLYRVYLLDFLDQDGDHAELFVDGVSLGDVYLKNEGTSFLIPLAPGIPAHMKLVATADGGGGVTVGFVSSMGEVRTSVLQVGESEEWQVRVQ